MSECWSFDRKGEGGVTSVNIAGQCMLTHAMFCRAFDFAALLKLPGASPSSAVSAALVDVYGPDVAELVVLSTHPAHRGKGLAKVSPLRACVWVFCWLKNLEQGQETPAGV